MRAPRFWYNPPTAPGILARALSPLGWLYGAATKQRLKQKGYRSLVPVICIGNINAGGSGKTPTVIALVQKLQSQSIIAHVVSKGYRGTLNGPVLVDHKIHSAEQVGDEPLLLAAFTPTWVAKNRAEGVKCAESAGAQAIILDDGFQNPSVTKDINIIVVDAQKGFGNGYCLPAGPLREPVSKGLNRADFLLSLGDENNQKSFKDSFKKYTLAHQSNIFTFPTHLTGHLSPVEMGMDWKGLRVFAFAGIGHPEKFFTTLKKLGADVVGSVALDDHQRFSSRMLQRLDIEAKRLQARLITTEKDQLRLPAWFRRNVLSLPVRLHIDDFTSLDRAIEKAKHSKEK